MLLWCIFRNKGVPATGLSPLIYVMDLSDGSLVVNGAGMSEWSMGVYYYDFSAYDDEKDYAIIADSVTLTGNDRYADNGNTEFDNLLNDIIAKTNNLPSDPTSETNATSNKNEIIVEVDANEAKIDIVDTVVDSIQNETDKIQPDIISVPDDYKANVSSLALESTSQLIKTETDKMQTIDNNIDILKQIAVGRWRITGNQLILYDSDDTTPLYTFDLKDASGDPTMINPYERTPA